MTTNSFSSFNFLPTISATLSEKGYKYPTEIQSRALPLLMGGKSVVGVSETGSGKTLAYALPLLHMLKVLENEKQPVTLEAQPRAIVMVPTRELGEQVSRVFKPFTHTTRLRIRTVLGGTTLEMSKRNVSGVFEVLVATPGRLVQLLDLRRISLRDVRILVFDEADQMLDQGFLNDARHIVEECPPDRQLALFSATVSPAVEELMSQLFSEAEVVRTKGSNRLVETLRTSNRNVIDGKRMPILEQVLSKPVEGGTLIFTNTREQCDALAELLTKAGHKCLIYRGEMDKVERRANLKAFRNGDVQLLISTDLAGRGLDVEHVGRVINYHLPKELNNYVHRVGRTARAGRDGLVINLVTERDSRLMEKIEKLNSNREPKAKVKNQNHRETEEKFETPYESRPNKLYTKKMAKFESAKPASRDEKKTELSKSPKFAKKASRNVDYRAVDKKFAAKPIVKKDDRKTDKKLEGKAKPNVSAAPKKFTKGAPTKLFAAKGKAVPKSDGKSRSSKR